LPKRRPFSRSTRRRKTGSITTLIGAARLHVEGVTGRALVGAELAGGARRLARTIAWCGCRFRRCLPLTRNDGDRMRNGASHEIAARPVRGRNPIGCCVPRRGGRPAGTAGPAGHRDRLCRRATGPSGDCRAGGPAAGACSGSWHTGIEHRDAVIVAGSGRGGAERASTVLVTRISGCGCERGQVRPLAR
jgi:hypothetical protein